LSAWTSAWCDAGSSYEPRRISPVTGSRSTIVCRAVMVWRSARLTNFAGEN